MKVMIIGMGSVGNYLANMLTELPEIELMCISRNEERLARDVNIANISATIRHPYRKRSPITYVACDVEDTEKLAKYMSVHQPEVIVNATRAYSHVKYGSISWESVRAYGIWAPLSVKYPKLISKAITTSGIRTTFINTSYSDAVNAWMATADYFAPKYGSGNINHLIPRLKALHEPNTHIIMACSHFHDVSISKEGSVDGVFPLLSINGERISDEHAMRLYKYCAIPMPTDEKRNMMNASSNFAIIYAMLKDRGDIVHVPGYDGMLGGYPVKVWRKYSELHTDIFSKNEMVEVNLKSLYLDGISSVSQGWLYYTQELIDKAKEKLGIRLPERVHIDDEVLPESLIRLIKEFTENKK